MSVTTGAYSEKFYFSQDEAPRCPEHTLKLGSPVGHLVAGVTSLGSEVVLYVKIDWLPNGAQNVRFLAGFTLNLKIRTQIC